MMELDCDCCAGTQNAFCATSTNNTSKRLVEPAILHPLSPLCFACLCGRQRKQTNKEAERRRWGEAKTGEGEEEAGIRGEEEGKTTDACFEPRKGRGGVSLHDTTKEILHAPEWAKANRTPTPKVTGDNLQRFPAVPQVQPNHAHE